ncbi:hypothetical protein LINPERHAP2_LOCUS18528 [Linum perenne]
MEGCGSCNTGTETDRHVFIDCVVAQNCWVKVGLRSVVNGWAALSSTMVEWLQLMLSEGTETQKEHIATILSAIWYERNCRVWSNKYTQEDWMCRTALDELQEWQQARMARRGRVGAMPIACQKWHVPMPDYLKCNTDAASFVAEGRTGAGMVIQDHMGELVGYRMTTWGGRVA